MNIITGGFSYPFDNPEYNYTTTINLALDKVEASDNSVLWFDQDISNDYRVSEFNFRFDRTQATQFNDLFKTDNEARNINVSFALNSNEAFYPFGADLGNAGPFTCALQDYNISPQMLSPFRYFDIKTKFKMVNNPVYSLPAQIKEGDLKIGSVDNLQNTIPSIQTHKNYTNVISNNGDIYRTDKLETNDYQTMNITIDCNNSNAGLIVYDIVNNIRGNIFNITAQNNNYFFSIDGGSSGVYEVVLDSNIITVSHLKFNKYVVNFSVRRVF